MSLHTLSLFVDKSLITFQREDLRYNMHAMLQQFSAEQLAGDAARQQQLAVDHAAYFGNMLGDWRWFTPDHQMEETFNDIHQDLDNVRAAWQQLVATKQFEIIQRGYVSLAHYYLQRSSLSEGVSLVALALQQLPETRQELRAKLIVVQARLWRMQADYEAVIAAAEQAIALGAAIQNQQVVAVALFEWSVVLWLKGQFEYCRQKLDVALPLAREVKLPILEAEILRHLGLIALKQRELEGAETNFGQALSLFRQYQSLEGEAHTLNNLGMLATEREQLAEALTFFKQSGALFDKIGDRAHAARALTNQANLEWMLGDLAGAIDHAKQALPIHQQAGIQRGVAVTLAWLGVFHTGLGVLDVAQEYIEQGVALCEKIGAQHDLISVLSKQGQWALQSADYQTAYDVAQRALRLTYEHGVLVAQDSLMCICGRALYEMEQYTMAREAYRDALQLQRERGLVKRTIEPLAGLARLAFATDNLSQAIAYCHDILPILISHNNTIFDPFYADLTCYHILSAAADPRAATILHSAVDRLQEQAQKIYDDNLRRSFLEVVPTHRALLTAV